MLKYFGFVAALANIGKAALDCDGAIVTDEMGDSYAAIAGTCTGIGDSLSIGYQCTSDNIMASTYYTGDCSDDPFSTVSLCDDTTTCDISCDGTPCEYLQATVYFGVEECNVDETPVVYNSSWTVPYPLDYCQDDSYNSSFSGVVVSSSRYTVVNATHVVQQSYDTADCTGNATIAKVESSCDDSLLGLATDYSLEMATSTIYTPDPITPAPVTGGSVNSGTKITVLVCASSSDCSGECTTETQDIPAGCTEESESGFTYYYTATCSDSQYTVSVYTSEGCSDDGTTASVPTGQCIDNGDGSSAFIECELPTDAPTTAAPTTAAPTTAAPTTAAADPSSGQYRIGSVVSVIFVCFVLSVLV